MSRPDEQLSTRDLASTPAEPRDEANAADEREDVHTSSRDEGTDRGGPADARRARAGGNRRVPRRP